MGPCSKIRTHGSTRAVVSALSMETCFGELIKLSSQCKCYRSLGCFMFCTLSKINLSSCFVFSPAFLSSRTELDQFRAYRWSLTWGWRSAQKRIWDSNL